MDIRLAKPEELDRIMDIYAAAQDYMEKNGNGSQWGRVHPPRTLICEDIACGRLFVGVCDDEQIHCVFALLSGIDPTYLYIENGSWLNDEPYLTIHRIASDGKYQGLFKKCMDFCKEKCDNLRIDTHENNKTMLHVLAQNGFIRCGIIYLENGSPRIAYHFSNATLR